MAVRVWRTRSSTTRTGGRGVASPKTQTQSRAASDLTLASQATRAFGVCARHQSRTASAIRSHTLSGCPSVTLSLVQSHLGLVWNVVLIRASLLLSPPRSDAPPRVHHGA